MITTITNPTTRAVLPMGSVYRYDQLNRFKESYGYMSMNLGTNAWTGGGGTGYTNSFVYDANGNITQQYRYNADDSAPIDQLTYWYDADVNGKKINNRLYAVYDYVSAGNFPDDIDQQIGFNNNPSVINSVNNYVYDKEGRLIKDVQEEIDVITWRVDGKVAKIARPALSQKKNLIFDYSLSR